MLEKKLKALGLTGGEYDTICSYLGREPNELEMALFGVMWSEHCSYKSSRDQLKKLPQDGPQVVQGPGENAGAVDIGDGYVAVFKIESHNHPSAIEPYQGAATGVGGIVRDIFTMGARPIAILNSLRFGSLEEKKTRQLFTRVVKGIGDYGNCIGVPTVGGEVFFSTSYRENPLVNAMCVGIARKDMLVRARAQRGESTVMVVGARTGRDGIQGASFASCELTQNSSDDRPAVQVGDPFMEKLLLEACLELREKDLVEGVQDLGAAGLTSAASEVASRSGLGMEIDVEKVPLRDENMSAMEIMLSESQERMLVIPREGCEVEVVETFLRWGLDAAVIGQTTEGSDLIVREGKTIKGQVPVDSLVDKAPRYMRSAQGTGKKQEQIKVAEPGDIGEVFRKILASPNLASKRWVYEQYDHMVGVNTVWGPGIGAALLRVPGTKRGLAMTTDGNGRYCFLDPYVGGIIAVMEAARNLVSMGARPLAVTDCLNFGSPEKPHIYWQFKEVLRGMALACQKLNTPIVSGNVSFYNETGGQAIFPTPVVGMIGLLEDINQHLVPGFQEENLAIILLGETFDEMGGSEYLAFIEGREEGKPPQVDIAREMAAQEAVMEAFELGMLENIQDLSEGGLALALAEMTFTAGMGAQVELTGKLPPHVQLFSESQSRFLLTCSEGNLKQVMDFLREKDIPTQHLGWSGGDSLRIKGVLDVPVKEMETIWTNAMANQLRY